MAYYLRPHNGRGLGGVRINPGEIGRMRTVPDTGVRVFVTAAPLVMHDECAETNGVGGHPWDKGREDFSDRAGQPLCWSPRYSRTPTHPCYWCGEPVT